jgi:ketose-bisphosphate aldolase
VALSLPIERLQQARQDGRGIAAFSVYNLEQALAVCHDAEGADAEVILQAGSSAFAYAGLEPLAALALASARSADIDVGVHLDHSKDVDEISHCIALGYTSVMFDGSALELGENERLTAAVVREAHVAGVWVEAELVGFAGEEDRSQETVLATRMTDPDAAARFVQRTGVDALAVAIGNVHGIPAQPVRLNFERLAAIRDRVPVPLVLHGASGLPGADVAQAIRLGVAKINVNAELRRALATGLERTTMASDDLGSLLGPARDAMQTLAREKIRTFASAANG